MTNGANEAQESYGSNDTLMAEIRRIKEEISAECGGNVVKLMEAAKLRQSDSGHVTVDLSRD